MTSAIKHRIAQLRQGIVPKGYAKTILGVVPDVWHKSRIDEICRLSSGSTPRRDNAGNFKGNILWVTSGELKAKFVYDTKEKVSQLAAKESRLELYEPGTVVVAIYGLEAAGTRGTASIIEKQCTISQACMAFSDFKCVDNEFFYYWYLHNGPLIGIRFAQGTKQQNLSSEIIGSLPICFPSLAEQRKIAKILATQDRVIELLNRKIEQLKLLKKCYLRKMFPQHGKNKPEVRFSGFTDEWRWRRLGEMGNVFAGLSGKNKEDFGHGNGHYVTYLNVFSNPISDLKMTEAIEVDSSQNSVRYGDIFFTVSSETPEDIGMSSVWLGTMEDTYLNSFCFGYRPKEMFNPHYIANVLRSEIIRRQIVYRAQGISRYNISRNEVMQILIPLPTKSEQVKVGAFFSNVDNQIALHQRKHDEEVLKKKALMQLLLTGIVRVRGVESGVGKQLPADRNLLASGKQIRKERAKCRRTYQ